MNAPLIYLDPDSKLSLQRQIRQKLVEAVLMGVFPVGKRLPSSRKLAEQLSISRNTVVLAYQQLMDEGYLVTRERSGIFVNEQIFEGRIGLGEAQHSDERQSPYWSARFKQKASRQRHFQIPSDWHRYPYPFLEDQFDPGLFPINEWREASRLALGVREVNEWAAFAADADDPQLIEEIRTKLLPARGIHAKSNEILVTSSEQQALYLLAQLFVDSRTKVAVEEPGNPQFSQLMAACGAPLIHQALDEQGMVVNEALDEADIIYVTPSHQLPTTAMMGMERRQALLAKAAQNNSLIIEDDASLEHNYLGSPHPALRSLDKGNRVIYLSGLSKILSPGLRLSYLVGPAEVIAEARRLRKVFSGYPPRNNQRAMAFFLSLGHYDSFIRHLEEVLKARWLVLRDALNYSLHALAETTPNQGGTAYWVKLRRNIDVRYLVQQAAREGILIEPIDHYYGAQKTPSNTFRIGITSIDSSRIREGMERLAEVIKKLMSDGYDPTIKHRVNNLGAEDLRALLPGSVMRSATVYGDPYTIEFHADGSLVGRCGYQDEDCDTGRWWIEGDCLVRQWQQWVYGERHKFIVVKDGDRLRWHNLEGQLVVSGILQQAASPQLTTGLICD